MVGLAIPSLIVMSQSQQDHHPVDPRRALWESLNLTSQKMSDKGDPLVWKVVVDNAKSHAPKQPRSVSEPEIKLPRKLSKKVLRLPPRPDSFRDRDSAFNQSISDLFSFSLPWLSSKNEDNCCNEKLRSVNSSSSSSYNNSNSITLERSSRLRHRSLRRSVSCDTDPEGDAFDRWMAAGRRRSKSQEKLYCRSSSCGALRDDNNHNEPEEDDDNDDDEDNDDEEPPACARINANKPIRQASEDPEEVRRLVESLRRQGVFTD